MGGGGGGQPGADNLNTSHLIDARNSCQSLDGESERAREREIAFEKKREMRFGRRNDREDGEGGGTQSRLVEIE